MTEHKEVETLEIVRNNLKRGDYDGVDIMRAWLAIDELLALREANTITNTTAEYEQLKADAELMRNLIHTHLKAYSYVVDVEKDFREYGIGGGTYTSDAIADANKLLIDSIEAMARRYFIKNVA